MAKKRVGIVIGGGDAPALNTVMNSIVRVMEDTGEYEILGFMGSFEGILNKEYIQLTRANTTPVRSQGGTILKSKNKGPFCTRVKDGKIIPLDATLMQNTYNSYKELGLECLFVLAGDGGLSTAEQFQDFGFNIIGVPKSIDNDLEATDFTFGFPTVMETVNDVLEKLHTTATSHDRIMVAEVMGRDTGWIALYGGIAGGANAILIPEIKRTYKSVLDFVQKRHDKGSLSSILVVSEGCVPLDGHLIEKIDGQANAAPVYGGIGDSLAAYLSKNGNGLEVRATNLGHMQRGGAPMAFDKVMATSFGAFAAQMALRKDYGKVVVYKNNQMQTATLDQAVQTIKHVKPDHQLVQLAKATGVYFGE